MKSIHLLPTTALAVALLAACDQQTAESSGPAPKEVAVETSTPDPSAVAAARAELAKQTIGRTLLGHTVMLQGDAFVPADLAKAPEYYLAYYSASW